MDLGAAAGDCRDLSAALAALADRAGDSDAEATDRTELLTPGATIPGVDADVYNQFFTLHGAIMVFLVIIPSIPAALGNFVLPIMLGAKDVAFPRMNLMSFYLWVIGAICAVVSLSMGGFDTGWTFYTPYSTTTTTAGVIPVVIGVFILGFASIFTGMNFIVTIHRLRPPGMTWFRMPLFLWGIYATAVLQVMATPVLGLYEPGAQPTQPLPIWARSLATSVGQLADPGGYVLAELLVARTCSLRDN